MQMFEAQVIPNKYITRPQTTHPHVNIGRSRNRFRREWNCLYIIEIKKMNDTYKIKIFINFSYFYICNLNSPSFTENQHKKNVLHLVILYFYLILKQPWDFSFQVYISQGYRVRVVLLYLTQHTVLFRALPLRLLLFSPLLCSFALS